MDLLLDLLQGAGSAAAIGIRPFLPVLLVGALAAGNLGIDFGGTDFAFLEQAPALAIVVALLALSLYAVRRAGLRGRPRPARPHAAPARRRDRERAPALRRGGGARRRGPLGALPAAGGPRRRGPPRAARRRPPPLR